MWATLLSLLSKIPASTVLQFITGINFGSVFQNIQKYWRFYLPTLLVAIQLGTLYGWENEHVSLTREKAAHQLDIADFKRAQAEADAKAKTEKEVIQKESQANADKADANYSNLYSKYSTVLMRYKASQSHPDQSGGGQLQTPGSGNGSSSSTSVLTITLDDANICAVNTARLQAVHDWAMKGGEASDEN